MKLYKVKDVQKYTGLTRKQLYDFEKSIPPVDRMNEAGYKRYDQEGLSKLSIAALLVELGAKPRQINDIFSDEKYDVNKVLDDILIEAKKQYQNIADIIKVTEYIKLLNWERITYNPLQLKDIHELASELREFEREDVYSLMRKNANDIRKEALSLCVKMNKLGRTELESREEAAVIDDFVDGMIQIYGKDMAAQITLAIAILLIDSDYKKIVDEKTNDGLAEYVAENIIYYKFITPIEKARVFEEIETILKFEYENEKVKKTIKRALDIIQDILGLKTISDVLNILKMAEMVIEQDDETESYEYKGAITYMIRALDYYSENNILMMEVD